MLRDRPRMGNGSKVHQLPGPSFLTAPHWAVHDRLVSSKWRPYVHGDDGLGLSARQQILELRRPILVLGLLTMPWATLRRELARQTMNSRNQKLLNRQAVVLRYLLAKRGEYARQKPQPSSGEDWESQLDLENATHGDIVRLPSPDGPTHCWSKVIEWMRASLLQWPDALYVGIADDDVYISLARVAYDLATLHKHGHRRVYWGQPMWMAHWNDTRFEGEGFGGTSTPYDTESLAIYRRAKMAIRRQRDERGNRTQAKAILSTLSRGSSCSTYDAAGSRWTGREVASSPFFFANTDLAIMGSDLVRRILNGKCLAGFASSFSRAERSGKFVRRRAYPCEPNIDQLLGWLVAHAGRNVTFVQAQFHTQSFPWMTFVNNRPSRHAFYVHKIHENAWWWRYTDTLFAKQPQHEPLVRSCTPCYRSSELADKDTSDMSESWVSRSNPSTSLYMHWTCCATRPPPDGLEKDSLARCALERAHAPTEHLRFRSHMLPLMDGYCTETDDTSSQRGYASCGRVDDPTAKGFWKYPESESISISDCAKRCAACAACKFVSFSESHFQRECSWFASCPNAKAKGQGLKQIGSELCPTFSTVQVRPPLS
jgi:hypothetical protein